MIESPGEGLQGAVLRMGSDDLVAGTAEVEALTAEELLHELSIWSAEVDTNIRSKFAHARRQLGEGFQCRNEYYKVGKNLKVHHQRTTRVKERESQSWCRERSLANDGCQCEGSIVLGGEGQRHRPQ